MTQEPLISIITPTLNQAEFIEDTIKSVMNQNYTNVEHIIVDGGSTDGTIEILKKYPHLKWISEKDRGQTSAINKGFRLSKGEIIAWLNSDDFYEEKIFFRVAEYFFVHNECFFLYGNIKYVDKNKKILTYVRGAEITYKDLKRNPDIIRQPSSFWRRDVLHKVGFLDENLHLVMDYDFVLRVIKQFSPHYIDQNLSYYRSYDNNKTSKFVKRQFFELVKVMKRNHIINPYVLKLLFGRFLDSLGDRNMIKYIFSILRKTKK